VTQNAGQEVALAAFLSNFLGVLLNILNDLLKEFFVVEAGELLDVSELADLFSKFLQGLIVDLPSYAQDGYGDK